MKCSTIKCFKKAVHITNKGRPFKNILKSESEIRSNTKTTEDSTQYILKN